MLSRWVDRDAQAAVDRYAASGVDRELALRVYTTRLLGGDPKLVLHGGGNTSVKLRVPDLLDQPADVLCVKGSGWDMAKIEPPGLPAVRLPALHQLLKRDEVSDEDMVRVQRANLLDPMAPNPSVETLLHAFLPHKYVDHTHANAIVSLVDQDNSEELCREVYGKRMGFVPYVMPGFRLAKVAADVFERDSKVEGFILDKHGIFTFGESARESYERMIEAVTMAETRLAKNRKAVFVSAQVPQQVAGADVISPVIRGISAIKDEKTEGAWRRFVVEFRSNDAILNFVNGREVARYSQEGVITPDTTIRIKNTPLLLAAPAAGKLDDFAKTAREAAQKFMDDYRAYFEHQNARVGGNRKMLDPAPRVVLVPGLGLFGLGRTKKDAIISADLAEAFVECITDAEAFGRFKSISEDDMFDVEYWSLEQAKLGTAKPLPLAGQVAIVTGAGGAIGAATAKAFAAAGAEVALFDIDGGAAAAKAKDAGGSAFAVQCDVTDAASVNNAFAEVTRKFGGVDILVSNAGAAWQGRIGEVDEAILRKSFELNFFAHQRVAQAAVKIMLKQGTGGCLLFNVSKQAVNPGPNFGPYGLPKAATLLLVRQYAVDYGAEGIRSNGVNADRIRSGLLTDDFIKERAKARGVSEKNYMSGNLLGREVTADDVAQAFLHQALELKTTGDITTVDGGNIAAALR
jgi:rhamnose utilization protein RhaD (predicted bifunctional aldolase and dehydrogenase)/NAD(P)-dependent dehydrogenase (short-subunit alcohol dehydrogenase family)